MSKFDTPENRARLAAKRMRAESFLVQIDQDIPLAKLAHALASGGLTLRPDGRGGVKITEAA